MLAGKNIILGITGSIAAYKAASLVRLLIRNGAGVKVILTPCAREFITPVTLATLSKNTVLVDFFHHDDGAWNSHVDLGLWADLFLIAPASANTMAKMAAGICDNLLLTTYLSARCPVMLAPAMDLDMYAHPATRQAIAVLKDRGHLFIEPPEGELASGLIGKGRMEEPPAIVEQVEAFFSPRASLKGKTILVTAGPTMEALDPVRFISNHSTGTMGYALAQELAIRGAEVNLVSGPVQLHADHPRIHLTRVVTAAEMLQACLQQFTHCDGAIFCAAVSDYSPEEVASVKLKKTGEDLVIRLKPNPDIAATLGALKKPGQITVGFALETDHELENASRKLKAKSLDFIVLNSMNDPGAGFGPLTNKVRLLWANGTILHFDLKTKKEVAADIVDQVEKAFQFPEAPGAEQ